MLGIRFLCIPLFFLLSCQDIYQGEGLPAQFTGYISDGAIVEHGEAIWGQRIKNKQAVK